MAREYALFWQDDAVHPSARTVRGRCAAKLASILQHDAVHTLIDERYVCSRDEDEAIIALPLLRTFRSARKHPGEEIDISSW